MNPMTMPSSAEALLWLAVIERAIGDALGFGGLDHRHANGGMVYCPACSAKRDAREWIVGGRDFTVACELSGLDPEWTRRRFRLLEAQLERALSSPDLIRGLPERWIGAIGRVHGRARQARPPPPDQVRTRL